MDVFEAALTEATTRWEAAEKARRIEAVLSKEAGERPGDGSRMHHFREAQKLQNEMIKYAAAIGALRTILGK